MKKHYLMIIREVTPEGISDPSYEEYKTFSCAVRGAVNLLSENTEVFFENTNQKNACITYKTEDFIINIMPIDYYKALQ